MDIKDQIGDTAGTVWNVLHQEGPKSLGQLKRKLNGTSELLSLALGWLAREDKVDIIADRKTLKVQLK
jgi:hypothetical protein